MRRALLLLMLGFLTSCSKGEDEAKPGSGSTPGSDPGPATPGKAEKTVKGTIDVGGAMTAAVTWKPDLSLTCACLGEKDWVVDVTMSDGAGTAVALSVSTTKGITFTSGKLSAPDPLRSEGAAGISGGCKPDNRNVDGVISADLDARVTGKPGEVTLKGHLDVVCRSGL